jgi:antitoxin component YwqK of YwqJK toxin-antitoxin module
MKLTSLLVVILFGFSISGVSQERKGFYDARKRETDISHARYYFVVYHIDSLWQQQIYFVPEKKLYMQGTYLDSNCKKEHGIFYYKYPSGQLESTGDFYDHKKQGVWLGFHPNGVMRDSSVWESGKKVGTALSWYDSGFIMDSSIYNQDESGISAAWFDNGSPAAAGHYTTGRKMNGKWQFFYYDGKLSAVENYESGRLVNKEYYDEQGMSTDTFDIDRKAFFASKENFQDFLSRSIDSRIPAQRKAPAGVYIVTIRFVVGLDGKVSDIYPLSKEGYGMEEEAMRIIRRSVWVPEIEHHRKVKAYMTQRVSFLIRG